MALSRLESDAWSDVVVLPVDPEGGGSGVREDAVGLGAGDHVPVAVGNVAERRARQVREESAEQAEGKLFTSNNDRSENAFETAPFLPPALPPPLVASLRTGKPSNGKKGYSVLSRRTPRMKLRAPGEKS